MKKGERILVIEGFYILGLLEIIFRALSEHIDKEEFENNYDIVASSIKEYICVYRGWKI